MAIWLLRRPTFAFAMGLALVQIPAAASNPAGLPPSNGLVSPEEAARRAFELCIAHASGQSLIAPEFAEQLNRMGFHVEADPVNPAFGPSPTSVRVMNTAGEIRAIGNRGIGNCYVTTSGAPTGPIEAAIKKVLTTPGTFGPGRRLGDTRWTIWRWQTSERELQAGMVISRPGPHSPHGLVLATVTEINAGN